MTDTTTEIVPGHIVMSSDDEDMELIGGFEPIRVESKVIDSLEASRLLHEWNRMPGQRRIDEKRVHEYMDRIDRGLWFGAEVSVALLIDNEGHAIPDRTDASRQAVYILNGQHSLTAISRKVARAQVTFKFYEVTRKNMEMLYAQFDDNKTKSGKVGLEPVAHMFGTRASTRKGAKKLLVPAKVIDLVGKAIYWVDYKGMRTSFDKPSNHRIIGIIRDREEFVQWLLNLHQDPSNPFGKDEDKLSSSWMWRMGVVAAMYKTWFNDRDMATRFWVRVLRPVEENDPIGHPEHLRNMLREGRKNGEWGKRSQSRILKACSIAWNAWRRNEDSAELPPEDLNFEYIANLDLDALESLYFQDISEDPDAVGTEIENTENAIRKTGKMSK